MVIVKVRLVLAPTRMLSAPNTLLMIGGRRTNKVAVAGSPVGGSSERTKLVVLFFVPAVVPLTFTTRVQEALGSNVTFLRLKRRVPAVAVMMPLQVPPNPLGVEITMPDGNVSVNPTPVSG